MVMGLVLIGWLFFKGKRTDGWLGLVYTVVAVAVAVAVAFASFAEWLRNRLDSRRKIAIYWLFFNLISICYVVFALAFSLLYTEVRIIEFFLFPVFLAILPLANALLDWVSLGITRGLLHAIHRGHHAGWQALGWAVADIGLALFFLFMIASLTTLLLAGIDAATVLSSGHQLLDLESLFNGLRKPWSRDYGWIHFMMLSTLIPTLVHFFIAGFSGVLVLLPNWLRNWILLNFRTRNEPRRVAFLYVSFAPLLALAAPALLLWLLYVLVSANHGMVGGWLLDWVRGIAELVDPAMT